MDEAEIKYLQHELIELFGKFQKVVDEFAVNRIAVRRKKLAGPPDKTVDTEWFDEYWRIERSPEFLNLAGHFEYYRRLFISGGDRRLERLFPCSTPIVPGESYSGNLSIENWAIVSPPLTDNGLPYPSEGEHVEETGTALGLWCLMSGLYYIKLTMLDFYNWQPDFSDLLRRIPTELGVARCILCLGEIPASIDLKSWSLKQLDVMNGRAISCLSQPDVREDSFERYFRVACPERGWLWFDASSDQPNIPHELIPRVFVNFENLSGSRSYGGTVIEYSVETSELNESTQFPDLWARECAMLQICYPERCQLDFVATISATMLEPICFVQDLNPSNRPSMKSLSENEQLIAHVDASTRLENEQAKVPFTNAPRTVFTGKWIGPLFDRLLKIENSNLYGLKRAVLLFDRACAATDSTVEYILYIACLEATLTDGNLRNNINELMSKRFSGMIATSDEQRASVEKRVQQAYQRRTRIVHGREDEFSLDDEFIDDPFSICCAIDKTGKVLQYGYTLPVREICRRAILSIALVIDRLHLDNVGPANSNLPMCDLSEFLHKNKSKVLEVLRSEIPTNAQQLRSCMARFDNDIGFWSAFQSSLDSEVCRLGFRTPDIFDDELILKSGEPWPSAS